MLFGPARMSQSSLIRLLGLLLVWMSTLACATPISVVDGIGEGGLVFGAEELITDWASLATEHNSDLPPAFTICSSVSVNNKTTVLEQNFWQLLSKNGSGGIYASITGSLESEKVQTVRLGVDTKLTSFTNHSLLKLPMQVYWYHSCTGMDMVSGHVQMIINGQLIIDQVVNELTGYAEVRPQSLQGNLLLGKMWNPHFLPALVPEAHPHLAQQKIALQTSRSHLSISRQLLHHLVDDQLSVDDHLDVPADHVDASAAVVPVHLHGQLQE